MGRVHGVEGPFHFLESETAPGRRPAVGHGSTDAPSALNDDTHRGRQAACANPLARAPAPRSLLGWTPTHPHGRAAGAAWAIKELLRQLLTANGPSRYCRATTSHRRTASLAACADANMPEAPAWPPPSSGGGPRSKGSSSSASPTPAPKATTGSSSRSSTSPAASGTKPTTSGASCCTARPAGSRDHQQSRRSPRQSAKSRIKCYPRCLTSARSTGTDGSDPSGSSRRG